VGSLNSWKCLLRAYPILYCVHQIDMKGSCIRGEGLESQTTGRSGSVTLGKFSFKKWILCIIL